eukprot:398396_1
MLEKELFFKETQEPHRKKKKDFDDTSSIQLSSVHQPLYSTLSGAVHPRKITEEPNNGKCPKAICCNKCMCYYICLAIMMGLAILIMVFVFEILPMFTFGVVIQSIHIQLFQYKIKHEVYFDRFNQIFLNGTGGFIVEAFSPNAVD